MKAASEGARIGLPELDLGTVPASGGTARLTRTVGRARARHNPASQEDRRPAALAIGLVDELHPIGDLKRRAVELAEERRNRRSRWRACCAVVGAQYLPLEDAIRVEREPVRRCSGSEDQREGMFAFLEKRRPVFQAK